MKEQEEKNCDYNWVLKAKTRETVTKKKKKKKPKRSALLPVSSESLELCINRLKVKSLDEKSVKHLIVILGRLFSYYKKLPGAIPLSEFERVSKSTEFGGKLLTKLQQVDLITCINLDSWKQDKARQYKPSLELIAADFFDTKRVKSSSDYYKPRFIEIECNQKSEVLSNPDIEIPIPEKVKSRLEQPTGFVFSSDKAKEFFPSLSKEERHDKLLATKYAMINQPLNTVLTPTRWEQKEDGRIYAQGPGIQGIPAVVKGNCLVPITNEQVWELDFKNFEIRILLALCNENISEPDVYQLIASKVGLEREVVKDHVNPILNRRTIHKLKRNIFANTNEEQKTISEFTSVVKILSELFPSSYARLFPKSEEELKNKLEKFELRRKASLIFFKCLSVALALLKDKPLIQMHDGIFFADTEENANEIKQIFETTSEIELGVKIPAKLVQIP